MFLPGGCTTAGGDAVFVAVLLLADDVVDGGGRLDERLSRKLLKMLDRAA